MHTAYILMGGNLGNRLGNLQSAMEKMEAACGDIISISSVYETAAWGNTDQPSFLNQVVALHTSLTPAVLMCTLLAIEEELGRVRLEKMGPRTIDLDILLIDDLVVQTENLCIPHPSLPARRFALVPLAEIAATVIHPVSKKTMAELLTDCPDTLAVTKIS